MGSSYIEYKGFGFWSRDMFIESWLLTLLNEISSTPNPEPWQPSLMQHWRVQTSIDGGCISLRLNDLIVDKSKEDFLLNAAKRALPRAEARGRETGELFIKLLEGSLRTTASSPINYLHWPDEHQSS